MWDSWLLTNRCQKGFTIPCSKRENEQMKPLYCLWKHLKEWWARADCIPIERWQEIIIPSFACKNHNVLGSLRDKVDNCAQLLARQMYGETWWKEANELTFCRYLHHERLIGVTMQWKSVNVDNCTWLNRLRLEKLNYWSKSMVLSRNFIAIIGQREWIKITS